jgi:hypothetical protein
MLRLVGADATPEMPGVMELEAACADEARRARRMAFLVECTLRELRRDDRMTRVRAEALVATTREGVLDLFPGSDATYNMLVAPRFSRVLDEMFGAPADRQAARVLSFRRRAELTAAAETVELERAAGD